MSTCRAALDESAVQATADGAVRLALDAQVRAGVDMMTDGEQRRDSYASFVGGRQVPLHPAVQAELEKRLATYDRDRAAALPWEDVKARLLRES